MSAYVVSLVRYEKPGESVRRAVELSRGLDRLPSGAKVMIKPNLVYWNKEVEFPKWGVITTSRVIEDMVVILKERGINDITIAEGPALRSPKDRETPADMAEKLGFNTLKQKYGVTWMNMFERPFRTMDLGDGVVLDMNEDILDTDFVVNLPVLKTHAQAVVSLGIKCLKGTINQESRKLCHNADPNKDLDFWISKLADPMPPMFTLIDGIYTLERGPGYDGRSHRSNILVASADLLSADMVGAKVLGHDPAQAPHLVHAANRRGRPTDMSDINVVGEKLEDLARYHEYSFPYNETETLPLPMDKMGIKGLSYRKYDSSLCTYCSIINGMVLAAIAQAWKGEPFDNVEVLNGKRQNPTPGMKHTILMGQCMYQAHKDSPVINDMIPVKSCPPQPKAVVKALHQAGINVDAGIFENIDLAPAFFMARFQGKPEFEPGFYQV